LANTVWLFLRVCRFCPSVFFYLASVVPAIWFLELNEMELRIENERIRLNETLAAYRSGNETLIKEIANAVPGLKVCQSNLVARL